MAPTPRVCGPAAMTTSGALTSPCGVCTPRTRSPAIGDAGDRGLLLDAHAERASRLGEADRRAVGVAPAVLRAEGAADDVVEDDVRVEVGDLLRSHPARGHAEALLQGDVLAEDRLLGGVGDEEEIALLAEADVAAEALGEGLPDADALLGEADIRLGRELLAHAAGGVGRGAASDLIALQHDHVGDAALGQGVGDGAAHDPGADDDDLGRLLHPCRSLIADCGDRRPASAANSREYGLLLSNALNAEASSYNRPITSEARDRKEDDPMADGTRPAQMPLTGVRVLDLGRHLAGPTCAMLLGDLGADVIKVEKPGVGEDGRAAGPPFFSGISAFFLSANRNKRSLTLDIKRPEGQAIFRRLAETADVVVENFRPGVMDALGIGYAAMSATQSTDHLLRDLRVRRRWSLRRPPGARSDHPGRLRVDERDRFRGR